MKESDKQDQLFVILHLFMYLYIKVSVSHWQSWQATRARTCDVYNTFNMLSLRVVPLCDVTIMLEYTDTILFQI